MYASLNVLGTPLKSCSQDPKTGWYRDGCCNTNEDDQGSHTVCAELTSDFLEYLKERGNDLITPAPRFGFPGLVEGNQWCVCAGSWYDAFQNGRACKVLLESTHAKALSIAPLEALMAHAAGVES
jgi:uncharacterized protein